MFGTQKPTIFSSVSRLGFGCASLGSRVSARRGLAALEQAFDEGINWFDLAPSYGDGMAESIFAKFAEARRDKLFICTKVGIAAGSVSPLAKMIRPVARVGVQYIPQLRSIAGRGRQAAFVLPLTGALVLKSLDDSLRRLGVDYVDVLALHDPTPEDLARTDVAEALERVLAGGKSRAVGIAGTVDAARLALRLGLPVSHLQFAHQPSGVLPDLRSPEEESVVEALIVTHSVFGKSLPPRLESALRNGHARVAAALANQGYVSTSHEALYELMLDCCLQSNSEGVVLVSMFSPGHLERNITRAQRDIPHDAVALLRDIERLGLAQAVL